MPNFDKLKDHHKNQLLAVLTHYMGQDLRHKLMAECPPAYNALCETDIVKVVKIHDNSEVDPNYVWRDCETCDVPFYRHKGNTDPNCAECNARAIADLAPLIADLAPLHIKMRDKLAKCRKCELVLGKDHAHQDRKGYLCNICVVDKLKQRECATCGAFMDDESDNQSPDKTLCCDCYKRDALQDEERSNYMDDED